MQHGIQDFYKVLKIQRNATQSEIKEAYRKLAFILHPDRHDGCQLKTNEFKQATEAYQTLSDKLKRSEHDKTLNGPYYQSSNNKRRTTTSPPPPNYRKVYAPHPPPPNFQTFNAKYHYDMHYGDGIMKEEIERARKRAEQASNRNQECFGHEYISPLGRGFEFTGSFRGGNPFARRVGGGRNNKKKRGSSRDANNNSTFYDEYEFEYEEGYMDMGNGGGRQKYNHDTTKTTTTTTFTYKSQGRQIVAERMKERRKYRTRNRGDPLHNNNNDDDATSCVIM